MPGYNRFIRLVEKNYFRDSPITVEDVRRALDIYGQEEATIQGRRTRSRPQRIQQRQILNIPQAIKDRHGDISISIDYLYVQGVPLLHSCNTQICALAKYLA